MSKLSQSNGDRVRGWGSLRGKTFCSLKQICFFFAPNVKIFNQIFSFSNSERGALQTICPREL